MQAYQFLITKIYWVYMVHGFNHLYPFESLYFCIWSFKCPHIWIPKLGNFVPWVECNWITSGNNGIECCMWNMSEMTSSRSTWATIPRTLVDEITNYWEFVLGWFWFDIVVHPILLPLVDYHKFYVSFPILFHNLKFYSRTITYFGQLSFVFNASSSKYYLVAIWVIIED